MQLNQLSWSRNKVFHRVDFSAVYTKESIPTAWALKQKNRAFFLVKNNVQKAFGERQIAKIKILVLLSITKYLESSDRRFLKCLRAF